MPELNEWETAVMFWAGSDPVATIRELKEMGVRAGQLGIPGDFDLSDATAWKSALSDEAFTVYTVFAAYEGESYADIPTVAATVGFVPFATREIRELRTLEVIRFAHELGVSSIATHIGCVPESRQDIEYKAIVEMVRRVCHYASQFRQTVALETGQEPAVALKFFLEDVDCSNLGINFDPANMILYGTGDPIEALSILGPLVLSVHCKDGDWPSKAHPGALGEERALGEGAVGIARYLAKLRETGYRGPLAIEREGQAPARRVSDIRKGIALLSEIQLSMV